jgi:hypothetical protein
MRRDGRRRSPNQITVSSFVPKCSYEREIEFLVGGESSPTRQLPNSNVRLASLPQTTKIPFNGFERLSMSELAIYHSSKMNFFSQVSDAPPLLP